MGHKLLKNAGELPTWIVEQQTIAARKMALHVRLQIHTECSAADAAAAAEELKADVAAINKLIAVFNMNVPISRLQHGMLDLATERKRVVKAATHQP